MVVVAHVAGERLIFHMIDQVDDAVQERDVVGNEDKRILILVQVAFQPFDVLLVQVVGGLVQQQDVRLFQQELAQQYLGTLAAA